MIAGAMGDGLGSGCDVSSGAGLLGLARGDAGPPTPQNRGSGSRHLEERDQI